MTALASAFQRPPTAQEAVLTELRQRILEGDLRPGSPIRQDAIALSLGVSRVPVREALKILEGEGQITYRPHRGYFVTELTLRDVRDVYRIRELLENEAIRAAVPRLSAADLETMARNLQIMEEASPGTVEMSEANSRFHLTLLNACGNRHLLHHIRLLRASMDAYRSLFYLTGDALLQVGLEHRNLYQAALERDAEAVVWWANAHRTHTIEALRSVLEPDVT